jgi:GT2 family glycosyltransferase
MLNYYQPNMIDSTGIRIFTTFSVTDRGRGEIDRGQYGEVKEIFGACAGAALYNSKMLAEVGLFDEGFFAYLEDVDLAWRSHLAGWKCMYVPTAIVYHVHSATGGHKSSFSRYMGSRNRIWCIIKNASFRNLIYTIPLIFIWDFVDNLYSIVKYRDLAQLRGKINALSSAKYKNIQKKYMESFTELILFECNKLL